MEVSQQPVTIAPQGPSSRALTSDNNIQIPAHSRRPPHRTIVIRRIHPCTDHIRQLDAGGVLLQVDLGDAEACEVLCGLGAVGVGHRHLEAVKFSARQLGALTSPT